MIEQLTQTAVDSVPPSSLFLVQDPKAWAIIQAYACRNQQLPKVETDLETYLGNQYYLTDQQPAFDAIFAAKYDTATALALINILAIYHIHSPSCYFQLNSNFSSSPFCDFTSTARSGSQSVGKYQGLADLEMYTYSIQP